LRAMRVARGRGSSFSYQRKVEVDEMTMYKAAIQLAEATADAYSADQYGQGEWYKAAKMLLQRGYTPQEAEAILLKAKYLAAFLDDPRNECTPEAVADLVAGTL
jgi:hypothetical protein